MCYNSITNKRKGLVNMGLAICLLKTMLSIRENLSKDAWEVLVKWLCEECGTEVVAEAMLALGVE